MIFGCTPGFSFAAMLRGQYRFRLRLMGRFARIAHTIRNKLKIQEEGRKTDVVRY